MTWYAADAVTDALDAARELLFPFDPGRWLRLAVVVFFVSGATGASNGGQGIVNFSFDSGDLPPGWQFEAPDWTLAVVLAVVGVVLLVGLLFAVASAVMQFVFYDALRTREVAVLAPFRGRFGQGLGLFAFTLVLGLGVAGVVVVPAFLALAVLGPLGALLLLVLLPFVFVLALGFAVTLRLTTDFAVPVAIAEDVGILAAWRRFWPTLRAEWKQFLVYLLVRFVLGLLVSVAVGIALAFLAIPLTLVFAAIVAGVVAVGNGAVTPVAVGFLVLVALPFALLFLAVGLAVEVPVSTYFGYFALLVLGDADEAFDLIPELRTEIRRGEPA